jgi:uncharacterized protein (DUF924 family)
LDDDAQRCLGSAAAIGSIPAQCLSRHAAHVRQRPSGAGHDRLVPEDMRVFVYLPLGHSEDLADQDYSVELNRLLGPPNSLHAERHRDIVQRFGRFPHRNAILGRPMTPAEQRYLDEGGFAG